MGCGSQPLAAETGTDPYADAVIEYVRGPYQLGPDHDPNMALGEPDGAPGISRTVVDLGQVGGHIILSFEDNTLVDAPGDDLLVYEITGHTAHN